MTKRTKTPVQKKKKITKGSELIEQLLDDNSEELVSVDLSGLDQEYILKQLKLKADKGDVRALELLGKHFSLFDKDKDVKDEVIDLFCEEGSIEDNIIKFLDILEDKYHDELAHSITLLEQDKELYLSEKEKETLLRQLEQTHYKNVEKDEVARSTTKSPVHPETEQVTYNKDEPRKGLLTTENLFIKA